MRAAISKRRAMFWDKSAVDAEIQNSGEFAVVVVVVANGLGLLDGESDVEMAGASMLNAPMRETFQ